MATGDGAPALAAVLDHAHARYFLVTDSEATELPCTTSPRMRGGKFHSDRQGSPGWGERGFHGRRREEERRHYAAVARRIGALMRAHAAETLVVGGADPVVADLLRVLPPRQAARVGSTARLNPLELTLADVRDAVDEARRARDQASVATLLATVVDGLGTGRAVDGLRAVLHALAEGRVRTLLVAPGVSRGGYRGARSGRLLVSKGAAAGEPVTRVADLVAAAAAETVRQGGTVVEIREPAQAARIDRIAALLRYR